MATAPTDSLWRLVVDRAAATPDAVLAVHQSGEQLTAAELAGRAEQVAAGLLARGVAPASVVSWQLPNRIESFVLTAALARLGVVQNPLVPILRSREVTFICREARSSTLVVPGVWRGFDYAAMARPIADELGVDLLVIDTQLPDGDPATLPPPPVADDSCRWIFYTSGTTAEPKGARHREHAIAAASRGFEEALDLTDRDRVAFVAPITHVGGIVLLAASLRIGCTNLVVETFDPAEAVRFFRDQGITYVGMGTPMFTAYLAHQRARPDLAPLFPEARAFISGGAPTPPALHHELRAELGTVGVVSGWGLTECPMLTWNSVHDADDDLATTEGRAVPGAQVVAVDPDGNEVAPGEEGELRVTGEQLMLGYVNAALDPAAFDEQGRLHTGDLGVVDERGYVRITGRLKDIIIRNMENISALELEQLLFTHPDVRDVAVVGVPDRRTGERVGAVVVPEPGRHLTLDQLTAHLRAAGISDRKLPELLCELDELPRNAMGKIVKADLTPLFTAG